jgi:hypothetical protein
MTTEFAQRRLMEILNEVLPEEFEDRWQDLFSAVCVSRGGELKEKLSNDVNSFLQEVEEHG